MAFARIVERESRNKAHYWEVDSMKKLVAIILVLAVTFAFAGCSGDGLKKKVAF